MADYTYVGGATNEANPSSTPNVTHGLTINSNDLVVIALNINTAQTITPDESGWTEEANNGTITGQTARIVFYWRVAGASEPSSYNFTLGASDRWSLLMKVFRPTVGRPIIDSPIDFQDAVTGPNSGADLVCGGNGQTIIDDAVSIGFGCMDRFATSTWTTATNSHVSVISEPIEQTSAMCHRLYGTGETLGSDVVIERTTGTDTDDSFGYHISFTTGVRITDVNTTESWNDGDTGLVITGSGFV